MVYFWIRLLFFALEAQRVGLDLLQRSYTNPHS